MSHSVVLCSTGAGTWYSSRGTDPCTILTYGHQLGVDLEPLVDRSWCERLEEVVALFNRSGLRFPVIHTQKEIGPALGSASMEERVQALSWLDTNCQLGARLGAHLVVLHLWGLPTGDTHLERNLGMLRACIDCAERYGLDLAVESIPCTVGDPLSNLHRACQQDARCQIALDTEFLALHHQVEAVFASDWLWRGEQRVRHIHIKDFDGQMLSPDGHRRYLHPGQGHIDFLQFFSDLRQRNFAGSVSLEAIAVTRDQQVDVHRLTTSLRFIQECMTLACIGDNEIP
ncbi:MAG TPA: sugar phosphate isomerase/epimerase family protein [Ktedonobacteraceae bacterium]|nr:sugar phosphate isomerase/epimerase family protein [Ktedonobacteraceae bacterium]